MVERSTRIMQEYFELRKEIVEISAEKEKLEEGKITAKQREKHFEKEMERLIEDIRVKENRINQLEIRVKQITDEKDHHIRYIEKLTMELEKEHHERKATEKQKQNIEMESNEGIKVKFYTNALHFVFII